jgi:hypothetical protein
MSRGRFVAEKSREQLTIVSSSGTTVRSFEVSQADLSLSLLFCFAFPVETNAGLIQTRPGMSAMKFSLHVRILHQTL